MAETLIHRFEFGGRRFAVDVETCFCFECDAVSWDVLEYYPHTPVNRIYRALEERHPRKELEEVVGELEWLRGTKSILPAHKREETLKRFEIERGLKSITVAMPTVRGEGLVRQAAALLFARSSQQKELALELIVSHGGDTSGLATACREALTLAGMTGKTLRVSVRVAGFSIAKTPAALEGHSLALRLEVQEPERIEEELAPFVSGRGESLPRMAKRLEGATALAGRIVLIPGHGGLSGAVRELADAGFQSIELDLEGALSSRADFDADGLVTGLSETAQWYAERLLKHEYLRIDPIAELFWRIYNGTPITRADPSGTHRLHVAATGDLYPSRLLTDPEFRLGNLVEGHLDEESVKRFEDLGVVTTPACMRCWARHLCGGGDAAVHHARTGSISTPDPTWCDAQRTWLSLGVSAFNLLSSRGVNFTRMYHVLDGRKKPSLFSLARAAFRMTIGMRPLAEADAPMLAQWENWNRSAYFLLNERATLIGNVYEREMDAVHPRGDELEVLLIRKSGEPLGLLKIRPDKTPGVAEGFLYLRDGGDYVDASVQKGFAAILKEAAGQQDVRRLVAYAAPWETGLQTFLEKTGFRREGELREALYARGEYAPCAVFTLTI